MSRGIRYTDEFKRDAVAQVTERGHNVQEVSDRLGITVRRQSVDISLLAAHFL